MLGLPQLMLRPIRTSLVVILIILYGCGKPTTNGNIWIQNGFELELAVGPPLVERPMIIDMDEQGFLYVAESSGSTESIEQQLVKRPHSILRLEDVDGDGKFDRRTVFADKMMLPEGVLWHDGSVYVAAPPVIWKLTDNDGDGIADQREEWFDGKTLTGCANDLHGPYLGPDGWIYWTKGAFAEQSYERPGGSLFTTRAAHIFRRRPEGGPIEQVLTGGMDNPIEVAFSPEGERFLTSTFTEHPKLGRRDGLIHALYGGVYGKVHSVTDPHPMTGGFNKVMTQMGATVPVGLASYNSTVFGEQFRGNLFVTHFNTHRITRHRLIPDGATYRTEDSDFLTSDSYDFHPTDVMEDADGSLLIVDTGAWYKICCPSAQLAKPEVLGAIYRVRSQDVPSIENPRGEEINWDKLSSKDLTLLLGDSRNAVQKRASRLLKSLGSDAIEALRDTRNSLEVRRNAVWTLSQIPEKSAREAVREALGATDEKIRHSALHSVSAWRDDNALALVLVQLRTGSNAIRRVAAEALGRIGNSSTVPDLLAATATSNDEALLHSLTYALIEIADPVATRVGLKSDNSRTRKAAMIALDQMTPGMLKPSDVIPLLSSETPIISEAAEWIAGQHPNWGSELAGYFRSNMNDPSISRQIDRFSSDPTIQKMLAESARVSGTSTSRVTALKLMATANVDELPEDWSEALVRALMQKDSAVVEAAVDVIRKLPKPEARDSALDAALMRVALDPANSLRLRAESTELSIASLEGVSPELFDFLIGLIEPSNAIEIRGAASRSLAQAFLSEDQLFRLIETLGKAGPMELPYIVQAFRNGLSFELGSKMLQALENSGGLTNLRADILEPVVAHYPAGIQESAHALLASQEIDLDAQSRRIDELLEPKFAGDARRGQAVFNSTKTACTACHMIGYQGGEIGPFLGNIGRIRTERDLIESIVYPSLSFVPSYESIVVSTPTGVYNGVVLEETDLYFLLATGVNEQVRINREDIEEIRPGTVSIMPAGLDKQLSNHEITDLVAFLKDTAYKPWQRP